MAVGANLQLLLLGLYCINAARGAVQATVQHSNWSIEA